MNFEAISRFKFEPIEKSARYVAEVIRISGKHVTMTLPLYERMGHPEFLSFGYDAENRAIGILVTDRKDPNATPCVKDKKTGTVRMNNSAFIANKLYELMKADQDKQAIVLRCPVKTNEYHVFELRNADIVKKCGVKKRGTDEL